MAANPLPILAIITAGLVFQVLVYGTELAEQSFPALEVPEEETEDCSGLFGDFGCGIRNLLDSIENFFRVIGGVIKFLFNLITFNVPDAPLFVRFFVGGLFITGIVWSGATLLRGN